MPQNTYFNLKAEKQERVYKAILKEYTRVPLEEVSIKNIILDAGIPRGSFYQYFQDKEDALSYLISKTRNQREQKLLEYEDNPYTNLFDFILYISKQEIQSLQEHTPSPRMQLFRQISKSHRATQIFNNTIVETISSNSLFTRCLKNSGMDRITSQEQTAIIQLLMASMKETLLSVLRNEQSPLSALQYLKIKLKIIKKGIDSLF